MGNRSIPAILREDNRREPVEGETFSSNPAHPYWRVRVRFTTGLKPSMERIRAATASQALEFVLARYPFACRSGSEVLGRWDAASAPIDHKAPVAKPAASAKPAPPPQSTPAPPPPMTKPILGADLKRLPRDPQGRALIDPAILPEVAQAHENGLSWPTIAFQLGCDERNLRERVVKWRKQQEARADAKEALQASVAERRQAGGPVPDGVPVGGGKEGREQFLPFRLCTVSTTAAQQQPQPLPEGEEQSLLDRGPTEELAALLAQAEANVAAGMGLPSLLAKEPGSRPTAKVLREQALLEALAVGRWTMKAATKGEREAAVAQQQPQPEPEVESEDAPVDSGLWLVHANGRMVAEGQPLELAERLVSVLAGAGIGCSRTPDEGVYGPRTTSRRVAFSRGYDQGQADARADLAAQLAKSEGLRLIRSDGVAAAIGRASDQPTPSPVITPTKMGGFTVQITVNPVESGG